MMPRSRYRGIGAAPQLFAPGTPTPTLSYDPHWCGQEVCGPPPAARAPAPVTPAAPPARRVIPLHFAGSTPRPTVSLSPPVTATAPIPPSVVAPTPTTGGGGGPPPDVTPPDGGGGGDGSCSCAWWKVLVAAGIGWGVAYVAQNKKPKRKPNPLRRLAA